MKKTENTIELKKNWTLKINVDKINNKSFLFWFGFTMMMSSFIGIMIAFWIINIIF